MGLEKIGNCYCTTACNQICDEFDISHVVDMVLFRAIEKFLNTGEIQCNVTDLLRLEWDSVNLNQRDLKKIETVYKKLARECIEELTMHIT